MTVNLFYHKYVGTGTDLLWSEDSYLIIKQDFMTKDRMNVLWGLYWIVMSPFVTSIDMTLLIYIYGN